MLSGDGGTLLLLLFFSGFPDRPLLKGKTPDELIQFIREQLEKREPYYSKAGYTLDVSLMDNYEKIKITIDKLKELLSL